MLVGLLEPNLDPEFHAITLTLRDAVQFSPAEWWTDQVYHCAMDVLDFAPTSPARVLVERLHSLGLALLPSGAFLDRFGACDPLTLNPTELALRLAWSWQLSVVQHVDHRSDFQGLDQIDVVATRRFISSLSLPQRALFRLGLCGGSFTEDYRSHWTGNSASCKWCGELDSLTHRYWTCPQTQPFRDLFAPTARDCWRSFPAAVSLRGWSLRPATWFEWTSALVNLPQVVQPPWGVLSSQGWNDVFSDGSCIDQAHPELRIASWGAILAAPFGPGWVFDPAIPLGSGVLPGLCQTAFRGELYALAVVLHWASLCRASVRVWIDCLGVINKFAHLTSGKARLSPNCPNADLWKWVLTSVDMLGLERVQLHKVKAHTALDQSRTGEEEWKTWYNRAADRVATQANRTRPASFWDLRQRHFDAVQRAQMISGEIQTLHLHVAEFSAHREVEDPADLQPTEPRATREFVASYDDANWSGNVPPQLAIQYGWGHAERATKWWSQRTGDKEQPVQWLSFVQLYIDYELTYGCPGPIKLRSQWLDVGSRPYLDVDRYPFRDRVRWFRRFIQNMLREAGVVVHYAQCRPASDCLQAYLPSVSIRWDPMSLQATEVWLQQNLQGPCTRAASSLVSLPRPNQAAGMAIGEHPSQNVDAGD